MSDRFIDGERAKGRLSLCEESEQHRTQLNECMDRPNEPTGTLTRHGRDRANILPSPVPPLVRHRHTCASQCQPCMTCDSKAPFAVLSGSSSEVKLMVGAGKAPLLYLVPVCIRDASATFCGREWRCLLRVVALQECVLMGGIPCFGKKGHPASPHT